MENSRSNLAPIAKKDRRVVTWSPQDDELLREQIAIHGTGNWASISANFKDKTSRQCRRRWFTYLNSEFKKGGWSPEEDMLLCEAQKILGNKWTEIAKVVSGRTDNAVKNRFSTLCKKRARNEDLYKENNNINAPISANIDNNRALNVRNKLISSGIGESSLSFKQMRFDILNSSERKITSEKVDMRELIERRPFLEISQNTGNLKAPLYNVSGTSSKGTFIKKDDPKLATLFQQAELLSSLAIKVNTGDSNERFDEAWKQLQEYMIQREGKGTLQNETSDDVASLLDDLKDLIEDLRNNNNNENNNNNNNENLESELQTDASRSIEEVHNFISSDNLIDVCQGDNQMCENFSSPIRKFPAFESADSIPSPKFSESERKFLLTVLGMSSPNSNPDSSKEPSCKRALI